MKYVKRDEIIKAVKEAMGPMDYPSELRDSIARTIVSAAESIDIVKCKECRRWNRDTIRHCENDFREWDEAECEALVGLDPYNEIDRTTEGEHYCSYGERKEDDDGQRKGEQI